MPFIFPLPRKAPSGAGAGRSLVSVRGCCDVRIPGIRRERQNKQEKMTAGPGAVSSCVSISRRHYSLIIAILDTGHSVKPRHDTSIVPPIIHILLFVNISVSPDISKSNLSFTNYSSSVEKMF